MERTEFLLLILASLALPLLRNVCCENDHLVMTKENEETFIVDENHEKLQAATFSFAKHFQNHMVLQKEPARANIYGFSPNVGQTVNAKLVTHAKTYTYSTTVEKGTDESVGVWTVELDAQDADTTATISVTSQGVTLNLTDVIFGDVWICSGQSNMHFPVNQMLDADAEKVDVNYTKIRLMTVADRESPVPLDNLVQIQHAWTRPTSNAVGSFSAVCWIYGKNIHKALNYSVGLIHSSWGGTPAESWSSPEALAKCGNQKKQEPKVTSQLPEIERQNLGGPNNHSVLWNSMIHPFLKMTIKGAIWYQGEADASGVKMNHYNCTFPTMINDWRQNFHDASNKQTNISFPFGFVQLAPKNNLPSQTVGFPDIRWHQTADHGYVPNSVMPYTFMAVAMDLPDFNSTYGSVHPRDKKDVGDRLSLAGLAIAYGRQEVFQGPYPSKGESTPTGFKITYGSSYSLEIRNTSGFELLCSSRWAPALITSHDLVSVTLEDVCHSNEVVKGVRYAWRESPCSFKKCAVYETTNGLPGSPFKFAVVSDDNEFSYIDFNNILDI